MFVIEMRQNDYKNEIIYKKWHIHLYMSFFFCNFAADLLCVHICVCVDTREMKIYDEK